MKERIRSILLESGLDEKDVECSNFIKSEILDSITIAEIVIGLEETYNIEIDGNDIIPENFENIETMMEMVKKNGGKE